MKNVEDDTVAEPTQRDLINAIAGRCRVSVLLVDETPAVKLARTGKGDKKAVIGLASPDGSAWRYATGETEALPRGEYGCPASMASSKVPLFFALPRWRVSTRHRGLGSCALWFREMRLTTCCAVGRRGIRRRRRNLSRRWVCLRLRRCYLSESKSIGALPYKFPGQSLKLRP